MNCPICKKPVEDPKPDHPGHFPFCSERCKLVDLGRWLGGKYQIPITDPDQSPHVIEDDDNDDSPTF